MLRKVVVHNYKSIEEVEVELGQFTVLVGPNGSGKSNFIDALRFVRDTLTVGLDIAIRNRRGIGAIRRWSPTRPRDIAIGLELAFPDGTQTVYAFELGSVRGGEYRVKAEVCETIRPDGVKDGFAVLEGKIVRYPTAFSPPPSGEFSAENAKTEPPLAKVLLFPFWGPAVAPQAWQFLRLMGFYHPSPAAIRWATYMPLNVLPTLTEQGENLSLVLWHLSQSAPQAFNEICENLRSLVPGIKSLKPLREGETVRVEHGDDEATVAELELWQESDGTLRLIALLTAMYQQPSLSMLVIEEPELTVHPEALGKLVDLLVERSAYQQVVLTTHSPDLLNYLPAETLRVVELEKGATKIGPLSEEQKKVIAEKYFKMGDLLRLEGLRRELPEPVQPPLPLGER